MKKEKTTPKKNKSDKSYWQLGAVKSKGREISEKERDAFDTKVRELIRAKSKKV